MIDDAKVRKLWRSWKKDFLLLFGIVCVAFLLRIVSLVNLPVFGDEAIYIRWSQVMRAEQTLRFLPLSDGKQPLYMWMTIPFLKIFTDPLFAGRLLSVLSGVGTTIGIFVLSYRLFFSRKKALSAAFIYALMPYSVFFDRMALVDSLLTFFGVWSLVFSLIAVQKRRLDSAMIAGFFLGGALLTKSPAIYFAFLIPLVLLFHTWKKGLKKCFNDASVFVFLFSFTYAIAIGLYNILRLGPEFHMIAIRNKDYVHPFSHVLTSPFDPLVPHFSRAIEWVWRLGPGVLIVMIMMGTILYFRKNARGILFVLVWVLFPVLASAEYAKVFTARYIFTSVPPLTILASFSVIGTSKRETLNGFSKILLGIFVIHSLWINYLFVANIEKAPLPRSERSGYLEEWTAGYGIKEVSNYVRNLYNSDEGQKIIVGTEGYFGTLPDGLQIYLNDLPEITVIGTGLDFNALPNSLVESRDAGNSTFFVVNSTRLLIEPEELDATLLESYPKALRPDGTREHFYFFEL